MRELIDAIKNTSSLLKNGEQPIEESVYNYIKTGYDSDWGSPRLEGFHPSEMFFVCPRQALLRRLFPKQLPPKWSDEMLLTFNHGHALHHWFQNRVFGPMGVLLGNWKCLKCDRVVSGSMPKKCSCGSDKSHMAFVERDVARGPFVGHIDGEILLPSGRAVLELKSAAQTDYIPAPLDYNVYQANIYMWMTELPQTLLVYISKKSFKLKTFVIDFDFDLLENAMARARDCNIVTGLADDELAAFDSESVCRICKSIGDKPASNCPWINECFNFKKMSGQS